jgi:hypothetical protein
MKKKNKKSGSWTVVRVLLGIVAVLGCFFLMSNGADATGIGATLATGGAAVVSPEQFKELGDSIAAKQKLIEEAIASKMDAKAIESLKTELAELSKKEVDELRAIMVKQGEIITVLEKSGKESKPFSLKRALTEALTLKQDEIEKLANGEIMSTKAVVDMTDATTIDAVGSASHYTLTTNTGIISKIRQRILRYLENVSVGSIKGNRAMWIEELDEQGTPIFIAEAATKTKISVRYEEREKKSKKIGVHGKVSTEMLRNLPQLVSYIQNNLMKRVDITTEDQLFDGNDTGNNLAGLTGYASAFTGGALTGTLPAGTASTSDVFRALALQVEEQHGIANAVYVRPSVIASMDVEKSTDGVYLMPPFRAANGNMIAGMKLISSNGVPAGFDFIGGDLSVVNVAFTDNMTVQIDRDGNDFTNNLKTILVEQELVQWVSANDTQVLVKGTIAAAITALEV